MPKAAPEPEITLYVLSIVDYLNPQPEDPLEPIGYMPVFRSEEAARKFNGGTGAEILDWTLVHPTSN
jgi:hypothetical protein